jgi:hypothetical protein
MDADWDGESIAAVVGSGGNALPGFGVQITPTEPMALGASATPTFDDVRQVAVVVWARTKFIERVLAADVSTDARVLTGLAEIDAAIAAIGERLDRLEDSLLRRAA